MCLLLQNPFKKDDDDDDGGVRKRHTTVLQRMQQRSKTGGSNREKAVLLALKKIRHETHTAGQVCPPSFKVCYSAMVPSYLVCTVGILVFFPPSFYLYAEQGRGTQTISPNRASHPMHSTNGPKLILMQRCFCIRAWVISAAEISELNNRTGPHSQKVK